MNISVAGTAYFSQLPSACLSSVLRHCSHLCEEKLPRKRCVNHVTPYAYLIKEPLDALSAAISPCWHWKKIPIRSFLCCQNHFSQLISQQTNNYYHFFARLIFCFGSTLKDKKDKVQTTNYKMSSFICTMDHWSAHLCHARHYNECVYCQSQC